MRRKSERNKEKEKEKEKEKAKPSPEKPKRGRPAKRRKKSSSEEERDSAGEQEGAAVESPPQLDDQVWHVKASDSSGDAGEIQKLKLCLARPAGEASPRGRKPLDRSSSRSDASETSEEKKRGKHRSRRSSARDLDKHKDSTEEEAVLPKRASPLPEEDVKESPPSPTEPSPTPAVKEVEKVASEAATSSTSQDSEDTTQTPKIQDSKDETNVVEQNANVDSNILESQETSPDSTVDVRHVPQETEPPVTQQDEIKEPEPQQIEQPEQQIIEKSDKVEVAKVVVEVEVAKVEVEMKEPEPIKIITDKKEEEKPKTIEIKKVEVPEPVVENIESNKKIDTDTKDETKDEIKIDDDVKKSEPVQQIEEIKKIEPIIKEKTPEKSPKKSEPKPHKPDPPKTTTTHEAPEPQTDSTASNSSSRKRKWGSRPKLTKATSVNISTDSLKNLISNVEPVSVEEVLAEVKPKEPSEPKPKKPNVEVVDNKESRKANGKYNLPESAPEKESVGSLMHRKISIVNEETSKLQRSPSPPKFKTSSILYITNLVRPFTLPLLKNLLQRTGKIVENGFWIDKIKSKCYVQYETEDEAIETRHALHGVTWPVSNPKTLNVDFGSREAMDEAIATSEDDKLGFTDSRSKDAQNKDRKIGGIDSDEKVFEKRNVVREWDLGKGEGREEYLDRHNNRQRDMLESERRKRRSSKSRTPSPARKFKKKEEAPPKFLEDLFKKTKTTPCIYWLPLDPEVILVKEEQRRKHMAEHERRLEELRKEFSMSRRGHHSTSHRHR